MRPLLLLLCGVRLFFIISSLGESGAVSVYRRKTRQPTHVPTPAPTHRPTALNPTHLAKPTPQPTTKQQNNHHGPTHRPTNSQSPTHSPSAFPTYVPPTNSAALAIKQAFIACVIIAFVGLLLGLGNIKQDKERHARKVRKVGPMY